MFWLIFTCSFLSALLWEIMFKLLYGFWRKNAIKQKVGFFYPLWIHHYTMYRNVFVEVHVGNDRFQYRGWDFTFNLNHHGPFQFVRVHYNCYVRFKLEIMFEDDMCSKFRERRYFVFLIFFTNIWIISLSVDLYHQYVDNRRVRI